MNQVRIQNRTNVVTIWLFGRNKIATFARLYLIKIAYRLLTIDKRTKLKRS